MPREEAFAYASDLSARLFAGEEALEGFTAFAEKRPPRWASTRYDPAAESAEVADAAERARRLGLR
jgi:hypothetical protein